MEENLTFFFDTYALVELVKENPAYAPYKEANIVTTQFNLAELYWCVLNDFGESKADHIFEVFRRSMVEVDDDTLKSAVKFRKDHKKRDLSYTDCIGYLYAKRHELKFLTGDKEFQDLPDVEFVKK